MVQLTEKMKARPELLAAAFRIPAITAYNRLEARPRTENLSAACVPKCGMPCGS